MAFDVLTLKNKNKTKQNKTKQNKTMKLSENQEWDLGLGQDLSSRNPQYIPSITLDWYCGLH